MNGGFERISNEAVVAWLKNYPEIFPEGLRKTAENLNRMGGASVEVQTEDITNTSPVSYRHTNLLNSLRDFLKNDECQLCGICVSETME
jgi:hypothetical protein